MKKISVSIILQILSYLSSLGIDHDDFLQSAGIETIRLKSPDNRISIDEFFNIQNKALKITGDDFFGLHLGEFRQAGAGSVLGYIVMNSGTLGKGLVNIEKYFNVVGDFIDLKLEKENKLVFNINLPWNENIRHCYDASVAGVMTILNMGAAKQIKPFKVKFIHDSQSNGAEYTRVFKSDVFFNMDEVSMEFSDDELKMPMGIHNSGLIDLFSKHAMEIINQGENTYSAMVKDGIIKLMAKGVPSIDKIALEIGVSVRSLQNRLKSEGTGYRALFKEVRKDLALSYLEDNKLSIEEISYILCFSEPSSFRRSFKKWTGFSPGQHRKLKNDGV